MSMTESEAIKNVTAYVYMECENMPKQVIQALDIMKDALEKQIPKKPKMRHLKPYDSYNDGQCPNCEAYVNEDSGNKHCPDCGQKLDWSDEE